jgi:hypothetical protein
VLAAIQIRDPNYMYWALRSQIPGKSGMVVEMVESPEEFIQKAEAYYPYCNKTIADLCVYPLSAKHWSVLAMKGCSLSKNPPEISNIRCVSAKGEAGLGSLKIRPTIRHLPVFVSYSGSTKEGHSGAPYTPFPNPKNEVKVYGMHLGHSKDNKLNYGISASALLLNIDLDYARKQRLARTDLESLDYSPQYLLQKLYEAMDDERKAYRCYKRGMDGPGGWESDGYVFASADGTDLIHLGHISPEFEDDDGFPKWVPKGCRIEDDMVDYDERDIREDYEWMGPLRQKVKQGKARNARLDQEEFFGGGYNPEEGYYEADQHPDTLILTGTVVNVDARNEERRKKSAEKDKERDGLIARVGLSGFKDVTEKLSPPKPGKSTLSREKGDFELDDQECKRIFGCTVEDALPLYGLPPTDSNVELRSMVAHLEEYTAKAHSNMIEPTPEEMKQIVSAYRNLMRKAMPMMQVPEDFLEKGQYGRVMDAFEAKDYEKSAGSGPWDSGATNGEVLGVKKLSEAGFYKADPQHLESLWEHCHRKETQCIEGLEPDNYALKVFVKDEYHKMSKIVQDRIRLIQAPSLIDRVIDSRVFEWPIDGIKTTDPKPIIYGWNVTQQLAVKMFQEKLGNKKRKVVAGDKAAWDWTMPGWLVQADYEERLKHLQDCKCPAEKIEKWKKIVQIRYYQLYRVVVDQSMKTPQLGPVWHLSSCNRMLEQMIPGIQKSGCKMTYWLNSVCQLNLHYLAKLRAGVKEEVKIFCMGDDTIQQAFTSEEDEKRYWEEMEKLGVLVKATDYSEPGQEFTFGGVTMGIKWKKTGEVVDIYVPAYMTQHLNSLYHLKKEVAASTYQNFAHLYVWTNGFDLLNREAVKRGAPETLKTELRVRALCEPEEWSDIIQGIHSNDPNFKLYGSQPKEVSAANPPQMTG